MSDEWKIVQGLKRENQNDSFGKRDAFVNLPPLERSKYAEERAEIWGNLNEKQIFSTEDKDAEEINVRLIRDYIKEQQKSKTINMNIGGLYITIDKNNPEKISFEKEKFSRMRGNYPYRVTINKDDIYSEVDLLDRTSTAYTLQGDSLKLHRQVTVIAGEEINEFFQIDSDNKRKIEKANMNQIIKNVLKLNPQYQVGKQNEIFRTEISPEEVLNDKDELNGLRVGHNNGNGVHPYKLNIYGDGLEIAKDIEERCKYIYSLIMEATKGTLEQSKSNESKTSNQDIIPNNTAESQESPTTNYDTDVESLSEEDLDALIEKMENLKREKQSKIERLQKIKKAQDLIALSKDQDKIIADLESQIEIEGVDFGEK